MRTRAVARENPHKKFGAQKFSTLLSSTPSPERHPVYGLMWTATLTRHQKF